MQRVTFPLGALDVRVSDRDAPPGTLRMVRNLCVVGPPERPYYSPVETAGRVQELQGIRGLGTQVRTRRGDFSEAEGSLRRLVVATRNAIYLIDPDDEYSAELVHELPGNDEHLQAQFTQLTSSVFVGLSGQEPGIGIPVGTLELRDDSVLDLNPPSVPRLELTVEEDTNNGNLEQGVYVIRSAWLFDDGSEGPAGRPYRREVPNDDGHTLEVRISELPDPISEEWRKRIAGLAIYVGYELPADPDADNIEERQGIEAMQAPLHRADVITPGQIGDAVTINRTKVGLVSQDVLRDDSLLQHELRAGAVHSYNKRLLLGDVAYDYYRPALDEWFEWAEGEHNAGGNDVWARLMVEIESPEGTIRRWSPALPFDEAHAENLTPRTSGIIAYNDIRALRWSIYVAEEADAEEWTPIDLSTVVETFRPTTTFRNGAGNLSYNELNSSYNLDPDSTSGLRISLEFDGTTSVVANAYIVDGDQDPQATQQPSEVLEGVATLNIADLNLDPADEPVTLTARMRAEVRAQRPEDGWMCPSEPGGEARAVLEVLDGSDNVLRSVSRVRSFELPSGCDSQFVVEGGSFEVSINAQGAEKLRIKVEATAYAGPGESEARVTANVRNVHLETLQNISGAEGSEIDPNADHLVIDHDPNRMLASDVYQPRSLRASRVYYVGDGPADGIVGFAANAMPVSEGQFGQYPLFVLCKESISAAEPGTGDTAFRAFPRISKRGCVGRNAYTNVDNMVAFVARDGLWSLARSVGNEPLSGPLHADGATGTLFGCLGAGTALGYYNDRARGRRELWMSAGKLTFCYSLLHGRWSILDRSRTHFARLGDAFYGIARQGTNEFYIGQTNEEEPIPGGSLMLEAANADPIEVAVSTTRMDLDSVGHWKRLRMLWVRMGKRMARMQYEVFDHDPKTLGDDFTVEVSVFSGEFQGPEKDTARLGRGRAIQPRIELRGEGRPGETMEAFGLEFEARMTHRSPASMPEVGSVQPGWTCGEGFDDVGLPPPPPPELGDLFFRQVFAYENAFGTGRGVGRIGWTLSIPGTVEVFNNLDRFLVEQLDPEAFVHETTEFKDVDEHVQDGLAVNATYWVKLRATSEDEQQAISRLLRYETSGVVDRVTDITNPDVMHELYSFVHRLIEQEMPDTEYAVPNNLFQHDHVIEDPALSTHAFSSMLFDETAAVEYDLDGSDTGVTDDDPNAFPDPTVLESDLVSVDVSLLGEATLVAEVTTLLSDEPATCFFQYREQGATTWQETDTELVFQPRTVTVVLDDLTEGDWEARFVASSNTVLNESAIEPFSVSTPTFGVEFKSNGHARTGTIEQVVVPASGTYRIRAVGAAGGVGDRSGIGGLGAEMVGDFALNENDVLNILPGAPGTNDENRVGGGGGSFVSQVVIVGDELQTETDFNALAPLQGNTSNVDYEVLTSDFVAGGASAKFQTKGSGDAGWGYVEHVMDLSERSELTLRVKTDTLDSTWGTAQVRIDGNVEWSTVDDNPDWTTINIDVSAYTGSTHTVQIGIDAGETGVSTRVFQVDLVGVGMGTLLIAAGGGGGYGVGDTTNEQSRAHATTSENGKDGFGGTAAGAGGTAGEGGARAGDRAGGGGGFLTSGEDANEPLSGGRAFIDGGAGGIDNDAGISNGGFGGGGAVDNSTGWGACGGGGGYSGGGGGYSDDSSTEGAGGGGGSFCDPANLVSSAEEIGTGDGIVQITQD